MKGKRPNKRFNLSHLEGVYDVKIRHAEPSARRMRDASKDGSASVAGTSQDYDDSRARAIEYGFDPNAPLPKGFFS